MRTAVSVIYIMGDGWYKVHAISSETTLVDNN